MIHLSEWYGEKLMISWGICAGSHDASVAVVKDDTIVYAAHAERSSGIKNDANLNETIVEEAMAFGKPKEVIWYEDNLLKRTRQLWAGQYKTAIFKQAPSNILLHCGFTDYAEDGVDHRLQHTSITKVKHHHAHAAAGYYTSPYTDAAILIVDSIGEWETLTIWKAEGTKMKRVHSQRYPHSLGIWYSAMTQRIGLKPNEDEYILMGMAACGDPEKYKQIIYEDFFEELTRHDPYIRFKHNLHRGCRWWRPELNTVQDIADIAAGTQAVYEMVFEHLIQQTLTLVGSRNIVLGGGCALNCVANSIAHKYYDGNVWIVPNPGDAGNSLGAILAKRGKFIEWTGPYLGHNIEGKYPVNNLIKELKESGITGVANGRAEFGPRALGNRSLLADPRGGDVKDRVNAVKRRQEFRPFAPVIMEEFANEYFDGPTGPYMQFVSTCKRPDLFPAIVHLDNTSRVQTVNEKQHPELYKLLAKWYADTGCPMLLNTSLNIKGKPMVDTVADAEEWQNTYNIKVCTHD